MPVKYVISFAAGCVASAVLIYLAHASAFGFVLFGFLLGVLITASLMYRPRSLRMRRDRIWTNRPAGDPIRRTLEGGRPDNEPTDGEPESPRARHPHRRPRTEEKPEPKTYVMSASENDAVSALVNFGEKKKRAVAIVRGAAMPAADFETLLRKVLPGAKS